MPARAIGEVPHEVPRPPVPPRWYWAPVATTGGRMMELRLDTCGGSAYATLDAGMLDQLAAQAARYARELRTGLVTATGRWAVDGQVPE